jgi:hypothetical protein
LDSRDDLRNTHHSEQDLRRAEAASWGARPETTPARPKKMTLLSWKPLVKNSLRGFASVELPIGLKIFDVPVMISSGKAWAALPSKMQMLRDGQPRRDGNGNGKPLYTPILEWRDRDLADQFSEAVVALVDAAYPMPSTGVRHEPARSAQSLF